jgi:hypothetical protein
VQQGACSATAGTTSCTLSGDLASGGSPGFTSGTYSFVTTFGTSDVDPIQGITSVPDPGVGANAFNYSFLAPDVSMVLDLNTSSGMFVEPLFTGGNFDPGTDFSFGFTGNTCSGTPVSTCDPAHVGLVAGSVVGASCLREAGLEVVLVSHFFGRAAGVRGFKPRVSAEGTHAA